MIADASDCNESLDYLTVVVVTVVSMTSHISAGLLSVSVSRGVYIVAYSMVKGEKSQLIAFHSH